MTRFDPRKGLIVIQTYIKGPTGDTIARLALDTGASATIISHDLLELVGYSPSSLPKTVRFTTGSRVESAPRLVIEQLTALDRVMKSFAVVAHTLPPTAAIDGVLGLDFLRENVLEIDFKRGEIRLF